MLDVLNKQRTFALVGNSGTGKTSLAEMLLYNAGVTNRLGAIEKGNTLLDYEPEETKRGGSVQPAFASYTWNKATHFLIDTPGDTNFLGDLSYLLTAADGVLFVVDAVDGVKPLTKKLWNEVQKVGLPGMVAINKIDRERSDFQKALADLSEVLEMKTVPLFLPIGSESSFQGVVDVLEEKAYFFQEDGKVKSGDIPQDLQDQIAEIKETNLENIAESDDTLMEKYLEEGELSAEEIRTGLRQGVIKGEIVPVCACSALENKAAGSILSVIEDLFPAPTERPAWQGEDGSSRTPDPEEPLACFVFKTISDPFTGQLSMIRVLSGTLSSDQQVLNVEKDNKEKVGQLLWVQGKKQEQCKQEVGPGAIVGVAKLKNTSTGDNLCDEKNPFALAKPELPPQLLSYAVSAADKNEEDKVFAALHKLLDEDITLSLHRNEETRDMLLSGMGQMHIETAIEKTKRRFKVDVLLQTPKVPYRESIKGKAEVQSRYKKQSGGRGQFGDCWIRMEPQPRGEGYEFVNEIVGGVIPKTYIPAVDKGIQEAAEQGPLAGYPVVDFKVTLFDGSYHSVDSSEMAFKIAGSMAFKKASEKAGLKLLEPIVQMTIYVPEEYMGDIIGDISSRRGKVLGYETKQSITEINAHVPMAEILRYAPDLRAMTGAQGFFTMQFDHYDECPPQVAEKVIEENKAEE